MNSQKFEEVTSFKYLGASLCKDGTCSAEVRITIALAMAGLNRIWPCNTISLASKFKLYKSLVTSILLYGCETWTLLAGAGKKDPGFRNQKLEKTFRHLLLGAQDQRLGAEQDQLPCGSTETSSGNCQETKTCMVQACFSLSKTTLQGTLEGGRCCGRQRKCWMDSIKEWTSLLMPELLTRAFCRKD